MATQDRISRLAQQIGDRLQNASHAPEDIQKGVQQVMRGAFDRMELVSREDFDILMDVLQRTRSRVEALERQVAQLEASLDTSPVNQPTPMEAEASATASHAEPATPRHRASTAKAANAARGAKDTTGSVDDLGE